MYPDDLHYTESHQWARVEGNVATIGITHYAQDQLGDLVYVELPAVDDEVTAGEPLGSVESVKAVADVNAPVSGRVTAVNEALEETPEIINQDPYTDGWIVKVEMSDPSQVESSMSAAQYRKLVEELGAGGGPE